MILRDYQERALLLCRDSMRRGLKRPIIAAPTAFGKTVLAAQMMKNCQDAGKKGFFFCDRVQLVEQTISKFREFDIDFGVRQANHPLTNPNAPIQIVSIQTISALVNEHGRGLPDFDMAIVDECHVKYSVIQTIIEKFNNIPIIGLTATPYSKGLGLMYNNLINPITPRELLDRGMLAPIRYYGGEHVDLSKVRSIDPNNYSAQDLESATNSDSDRLAGCVIANWQKYGENAQTIAFSPTQALSRNLVARFNENGISAEHVDSHTPADERQAMYAAHNAGEFKVLSCAQLLGTGYDSPSTRCLVDCYPVKSVTTFVQRAGRISRLHPEGLDSIYLDHASNFERFGFAEDIVPESLHDGKTVHRETDQIAGEKKEPKTRECPDCHQQMTGYRCKACGYTVSRDEQIEDDGKMLVELTGSSANRKDTRETKEQFYSELIHYGKTKGYKDGWSANQYKEKYGVWPNKIAPHATDTISPMITGWIRHQAIKRAKGKQA